MCACMCWSSTCKVICGRVSGCISCMLICLTTCFQRQWKMQKERFTDEFSKLLKDFQTVQREAVEKMRASVKRARAHSGMNQVGKHPAVFDFFSGAYTSLLLMDYHCYWFVSISNRTIGNSVYMNLWKHISNKIAKTVQAQTLLHFCQLYL